MTYNDLLKVAEGAINHQKLYNGASFKSGAAAEAATAALQAAASKAANPWNFVAYKNSILDAMTDSLERMKVTNCWDGSIA